MPDPTPTRHAILRTDVWHTRIEDHATLNAVLLDEIRSHQQQEPTPLDRSFPNCWRGVRKYAADPPLVERINAAAFSILSGYRSEEAEAREALVTADFVTDVFYWTNINGKNALNELHNHAHAGDLAGVYYVQGTETGEIVFKSEQWSDNEHASHIPFTAPFVFEPHDGDLILFPSYLKHEVRPNPSERERINLAFNVTVIRKGSGPAGLSRVQREDLT